MQHKYMENILRLPPSAVRCLERAYRLPRKGSLFFRLDQAGIDHARATLMLLQCGQIDGVEIMLGRRITICPTCLSRRFETLVTKPQSLDDLQLITAVDRNPRLPTTPSFQRYQALRLGMTVAQALRRGVRRRDLREWRREGSVKIEERRA